MKIIYIFFLYLFIAGFSTHTFAREIDWEKLSFGVTTKFSLTGGDLNKYWGNIPTSGFLLQYRPEQRFFFEGLITGWYLKPKENYNSEMPNIIFINSTAALKYNLIFTSNINFNISAGLTNTTFIFSGKAAEKLGDNIVEHEFGISLSSGVEFIITQQIWLEFFLSVQSIFSSPVNLGLYSFGIKVLWK